MAYSGKKGFVDFEREVGAAANGIIVALKRGQEVFDDLVAFRGARSNATLATDLGVAEAWIDDLETAVIALNRLHNAGDGQALVTQDYFDDLRLFT